jgi:hypothetical protein
LAGVVLGDDAAQMYNAIANDHVQAERLMREPDFRRLDNGGHIDLDSMGHQSWYRHRPQHLAGDASAALIEIATSASAWARKGLASLSARAASRLPSQQMPMRLAAKMLYEQDKATGLKEDLCRDRIIKRLQLRLGLRGNRKIIEAGSCSDRRGRFCRHVRGGAARKAHERKPQLILTVTQRRLVSLRPKSAKIVKPARTRPMGVIGTASP